MSLTLVVISTLLIVVALSSQDAFASEEGPKQKHLDKHEEKHEGKHEDKKKDKHEDKNKDKHEDQKKDKHEDKNKDKHEEKSDENTATNDEDDSTEQNPPISNDEDEITSESENIEDGVVQNPTPVEETKKFKMNQFKGSGNDYAPTLGTDRYGNNYVDNGFTFNDFVTNVDDFKTHMPLQTLQVGQLNTVVLKIYDNRGASKIEHVELAFGLGYDQFASQSQSKIIWKQNVKGDQIILEKDTDNLLMDVGATGKADGKIMEITFNFAFREPMDKSKIGLVVWDQDKHSRTVYFNDGIEVVGQSLNPPKIVTILDEKGYPVKITMTGKNEGVDEFGNIWTHNSPWIKQDKAAQSLNDSVEFAGNHGFDRWHGMFDSYKISQAQAAQEKLKELLGGHNIYNFND